MIHHSRLIVSPTHLAALVLCCFSLRSPAVVAPEHGSLTNLDKRITGQAQAALAPERAVALNKVQARIPDLQIDFDEIVGSPKWIRSRRGFLTTSRPSGGWVIPPRNPGVRIPMPDRTDDRHAPVKEFLDRHADLFEHGSEVPNATASPFTVTFIGEVLQGYLTKAIPAGVSIRGSLVPQAGGITSLLGFGTEDGLAHGDRIDRYNNGLYDIYQYLSGNWYRTTPSPTILLEPQPAVVESVWFNVGGSRNWKRDFSVWP